MASNLTGPILETRLTLPEKAGKISNDPEEIQKNMSASNRVLHAILDHMLEMLPDEPADSKRLDDIIDADASGPSGPLQESTPAGATRRPSRIRHKAGAKMRAAS